MSKLMIIFLSSLFSSYGALYCASKIIDKKINYKKLDFWLCYFLLILYTTVSYSLTDSFARVIIYYLLLSVVNLFLFKIKVMRSVVASFIMMVVVFIAEILYTLTILSIFVNDIDKFKTNFFGDLISNIVIFVIMILIINIKPIQNFCKKMIKNTKFNGDRTILIYSILSLTALSILLYYIYFEIDIVSASLLCLILVVTFSLITLYLFKEKNDNQKLQVEYDILLDNLIEYEQMYQMQKMINHENKNELSTIRGLASKSNKKLLDYIDELIDIKVTQKEKWMDILKRIPDPALRGLLYYKMANMEHKKINIDFDISRQVTIKKFKSISSELNKKACKILGIYLDNAIQAVENLKDKNIKVSIYLDVCEEDILVISVMNNYKGFIEMDCLYEKGYSTKGKGRGLGLPMVKDILDNEPGLSNQTQIIRNNFVQELKIKLKQQ